MPELRRTIQVVSNVKAQPHKTLPSLFHTWIQLNGLLHFWINGSQIVPAHGRQTGATLGDASVRIFSHLGTRAQIYAAVVFRLHIVELHQIGSNQLVRAYSRQVHSLGWPEYALAPFIHVFLKYGQCAVALECLDGLRLLDYTDQIQWLQSNLLRDLRLLELGHDFVQVHKLADDIRNFSAAAIGMAQVLRIVADTARHAHLPWQFELRH